MIEWMIVLDVDCEVDTRPNAVLWSRAAWLRRLGGVELVLPGHWIYSAIA
jgi:hypothetical protein